MPVPLYLDVHVPLAIAEQLRRRGVDVVHAIEEGTHRLADDASGLPEGSTGCRAVVDGGLTGLRLLHELDDAGINGRSGLLDGGNVLLAVNGFRFANLFNDDLGLNPGRGEGLDVFHPERNEVEILRLP